MPTIASPFESFNARALDPAQVARTFVPPRLFTDLVKHRHTVLVGPRGSGKTTLLKMLQGAALEAWCAPEADQFRGVIDYTGVFIPADRAWGQQVGALGGAALSSGTSDLLGQAAFVTHVLLAVARAVQYRLRPPPDTALTPHRRIPLTLEAEAVLAGHLALSWKVQPAVPSLSGLLMCLTNRLIDVRAVAQSEMVRGEEGRAERLASADWLHIGVLEAVVAAVEAFEQSTGERDARWALLFDEMEVAPAWARELLFSSMRSVDQRLLFKLSLSPLTKDTPRALFGPAPGHDHDVLPLWYPRKEDARSFSGALLTSMIRQKGLAETSAEVLLGRSPFDGPEVQSSLHSSYGRRSPTIRRFIRLAAKDRSFAQYLRDHQIDLSRPETLNGVERAQLLRKIVAVVIVRDAFLQGTTDDDTLVRSRRRSRKNADVYHGEGALFAIAEGNPRLLIGIVDRLLSQIRDGRIQAVVQSREVNRTAALFEAFLRTIPSPGAPGAQQERGVLGLIRAIGLRFSDYVIKEPFDPEPPGSFVVDSDSSEELLDGLGQAVNAGALIYVPGGKQSELILNSLRGKRFRLSYLLATDYQLPLMLMREVALSSLLRPARSPGQPELFERRP